MYRNNFWRFLAEIWPKKITSRDGCALLNSGIAGNSAVGIKFVPFNRRENRRSLAIFFAVEIAHLGALKIARFCGGAVKIAAATAENRAILVHSVEEQLWERLERADAEAAEQNAAKAPPPLPPPRCTNPSSGCGRFTNSDKSCRVAECALQCEGFAA